MDRSGVTDKRGRCQISFVLHGERFRIVLRGLMYERATDRKQAARILATVQREIQIGTFYFPKHFPWHPSAKRFLKGHQLLIGDALRTWLQLKRDQVARGQLEPTTYRGYEKDVLHHLVPTFGELRMSELRTSDVEDWLSKLGITGKTKNDILIPFRSLLKKALRDELIDRDPLAKIENQPHRSKEPDPLSTDEIERVLTAAEGQVRNIIQFAIWTGLRTSELIAVRWEDVDLDERKVQIRMTRTSAGEKAHGKTALSTRSVDLHPAARAALMDQTAFTRGKRFVFDNPRTNEPWKHDGPYRKTAWTPTLTKAGVRYRPAYQTRHTFASMLLSQGIEPMYVASQMGHRDWGMIRKTYGRWMPEYGQGQREKIAALWAPGRHQRDASR